MHLQRFAPGEITRGQTAFLLVLLVLGFVLCWIVPYGGGFDEEQHLRRVWELSAGVLLPNARLGPDMPIPAVFTRTSYREQPIVRPVPTMMAGGVDVPLDADGWIYDDASTRSVYSPLLLAPQALVMRYAGRKYDRPFAEIVLLARMVGLISYLLLCYWAIRLVPFGKWLMAALVAAPTAVFQGSTVTADSISNGIGFLFIGGSLALLFESELRWRHILGLLGLSSLLLMAKINLAPMLVLPLLLMRPSSISARRAYLVMAAGLLTLFIIEGVGWSIVSTQGMSLPAFGADPLGQLEYLLSHPLGYIVAFVRDLWLHGFDYVRGWVAAYGYYYWRVPSVTYVLYAAALICAVLLPQRKQPSRTARWTLVAVFIASVLATAVALQLTAEPVGSPLAHELQGRYFTPLAPLLLLALAGLAQPLKKTIGRWLVPALLALGLALFVSGAFLSYHVPCGSSWYSFGLCRQPEYKNWAPGAVLSPQVTSGTSFRQEFTAECNGLTEIRVWAAREAVPHGRTLDVRVAGAAGSAEIQSVQVPVDGLDEAGWLVVRFDPIVDSDGRRYRITIGSPGSAASGVRLSYTQRPEYRAGDLFVAGRAVDQDLFFQYGCSRGLNRALRSLGLAN